MENKVLSILLLVDITFTVRFAATQHLTCAHLLVMHLDLWLALMLCKMTRGRRNS